MNILRSHRLALLLFLFSSLLARASAAKTYVSVNGNDGNASVSCPAATPCRSFNTALSVTSPYGEIVAVDSGDYDPVTVTQSVTIKAAPGVDATILPLWGAAITITAGAYDIVVVRGLNMDGLNYADAGIRFTAGGVLNIENCSISHFIDNGITIEAAGNVNIKDTEVVNASTAIRLQSPTGVIHASIDRVHLDNSSFTGLYAGENSQATIRNSILTSGGYYGIQAGDYVGSTDLNVEDCVIQGFSTGIIAGDGGGGGTAIVRVAHSTIANNSTGLTTFGAPLLSYGNNRLAGNGTDGSFTGLISLQ